MMKIVAIVLCMSVLVASQDFLGDGLGQLLALNMISGRQPFALFGGGAPVPQAGARTGAGGARTQMSSNPYGGLTSLLVLGAL